MLSLKSLLEEYMVHCEAERFSAKTMQNKDHELGHLYKFLTEKRGVTQLDSISEFDMKAYFRHRQKTGLQPSSLDAIAKVVAAFMNWCVREEYLTDNRMGKVEIPKLPKRVTKGFTNKEVIKMIGVHGYKSYLDARNKALISVLVDTGIRAKEIRGLKPEDIKENTILIRGKGDKERVVFISSTLKKVLIRYERMRKQYFSDKIIQQDYYFLTYQGNGMSHLSLHNVIKDTAKKANVKDAHIPNLDIFIVSRQSMLEWI